MGDSTDSILKGDAAGLSFLHQQDATALSCALANLSDEVLLGPLPVHHQRSASEEPTAASDGRISSSFVITASAVLCWDATTANVQNDLSIPGSCIDLHAILAGDDDDDGGQPAGVYLQLSSSNDDDDELMELTIYPESPSTCEDIFRAVAKLIELHPQTISDDDDDSDGMIMASDLEADTAIGATLQEREEMLERLDRLLVVPPEYEVVDHVEDGQFDDADEEHDLL